MNECHLALTITHIREESKGLRRVSGLAKVTLFSISHASTLIQDLTSFLALGLTRWSPILFQKEHGHPCLKPLQTASSEHTDSREWQGGGSKQRRLGWSQGTAAVKQVNQSPWAERGAAQTQLVNHSQRGSRRLSLVDPWLFPCFSGRLCSC